MSLATLSAPCRARAKSSLAAKISHFSHLMKTNIHRGLIKTFATSPLWTYIFSNITYCNYTRVFKASFVESFYALYLLDTIDSNDQEMTCYLYATSSKQTGAQYPHSRF